MSLPGRRQNRPVRDRRLAALYELEDRGGVCALVSVHSGFDMSGNLHHLGVALEARMADHVFVFGKDCFKDFTSQSGGVENVFTKSATLKISTAGSPLRSTRKRSLLSTARFMIWPS